MGELTRVAASKDIEVGQAIAVEVNGQRIAIFNLNGVFTPLVIRVPIAAVRCRRAKLRARR